MKSSIFFLLFASCLAIDDYVPEGPLKFFGFGKFTNRKKFNGEDVLFDAFNSKNPLELMTKDFKFDKSSLMKKIELKKFEMHAGFVKDSKNVPQIKLPPIPSYSITATSEISIHNPLFTYPTDQIIFIEYQNETKTEIRVAHELISAILSRSGDDEEQIGLKLYENSIDMAISSEAPCRLGNLGKVVEVEWLERFINVTCVEGNATRFFVNEKLLTGPNTILGKTFYANVMILGPMCGTVMLNNTVKETADQNDKPTIYGATFNRNFDGFVKIIQHANKNDTFGITEVEYYLHSSDCNSRNKKELEDVEVSNITSFSMPGIGTIFERTLYPCENELLSDGQNETYLDEVTLKNYGQENSFVKLPVAKSCQKQYTAFNNFTSVTFGNDTLQLVITKNGSRECVQLEKWQEFPFRYTVFTTQEYEDIKEELASKVSAHPFQVSIDYSRELFEDICSILNATFTGTPSQIDQFQQIFNLTEYRFHDAEPLNCTSSDKINNEFALKSLRKYLSLIAIPLMILMFGALLLAASMGA